MTTALQLLGAMLVMLAYAWIAAMAAVAALATILCGVEICRARQDRRCARQRRERDRIARLQEHTATTTVTDDELRFWVGPNAERAR
jgi:hypothetical protein